MATRPAAGGGRWVEVDPARLDRWLDGFAQRHGEVSVTAGPGPAEAGTSTRAGGEAGVGLIADADHAVLHVVAADGAVARLHPPPGAVTTGTLAEFVAEAQRPRRLGLLLARQASVAAGLADGPVLVQSKVESSYVQSRTAAGGWSQQRFARRRVNQAKAAAGTAADLVARLLLPHRAELAALVTGGDRRTVDTILADPRLAPLAELRAPRLLDVAEPRRVVLEQALGQARAVLILIREPGEVSSSG
ncbi:MAG TPA: acVLRF1 family peptidyl-tRNA hydrolase [Micromonosporaceae bacterium]